MTRRDKGGEQADGERRDRLAEQLRANLARRKNQARARRAGAADERPEGLADEAGKTPSPSSRQD